MKRSQKFCLTLGGVAVLAMLPLVTPRAAHAVAAVLVQVTNTPSNPASVLDAGNPANEPFAWEGISTTTPVNTANFTTPSTTADGRTVERLVIEHVSAACNGLPTLASGIRVTTYPAFSRAGATLGVENDLYVPFANNPAPNEQVLTQPTRIYVDPGVTVQMNLLDFESGGICSYTAFGHFVVQ